MGFEYFECKLLTLYICLALLDKAVPIQFKACLYSHEVTVELLIRGKVWGGCVHVFVTEGCFLLKQQQISGQLLHLSASSLSQCLHVALGLGLSALKPNGKWPLAGSAILNTVGHCRRNSGSFCQNALASYSDCICTISPHSCTSFGKVRGTPRVLASRGKLGRFRATKI